MSVATQFQNGAAQILRTFARSLIYTSFTQQTYYPATGVATAPTQTSVAISGGLCTYHERLINGTTILASDRRCLIAGNSITFEPKIGDTVLAGTDLYRVVERFLCEIGNSKVLWDLQLRR